MAATPKKKPILIMAIASIIGGVVGYVAGLYWLSPGILIPIGVVVGIAVGLAFANGGKKS